MSDANANARPSPRPGAPGKPPPVRRRLARQMVKSIADYGLIEADDHVMVCMSGGKDSYTLLDLLAEAQRKAPFPFRLTAVHLDQQQPGYDGAPLRSWLEGFGTPFEIVSRDTSNLSHRLYIEAPVENSDDVPFTDSLDVSTRNSSD